jgi:gliding motility-associated-like protein
MKIHLSTKLSGVHLKVFTSKPGLFIFAVLFCFCNDLLAGVNPTRGFRNSYIKRSISIASPTITAGAATGSISACAGMASVSPNIKQIRVSGSALTANITVTAPTGFEISRTANGGYVSNLTLSQSGGVVNNTTVYVRSAASAPTGSITGNVTLTSAGAASQNVTVTGFVNALPTVNPVSNQTVNNGATTAPVNFTGSGGFNWVNNTPGIGLAASGSGNIPAFTAINTGSTPITATITVTPVSTATGFAYIPNHDSNNVSVINTATNTVVATIPVGTAPFGVAATPDGSTVYIANSGASYISVINTKTNTVVNTIQTGSVPFTLVVAPDGSKLYVVVSNNVLVINTATNVITDTIPIVGGNTGISISPDGSRVYVANSITGSVTVINTTSKTVIATIPVGSGSRPYPIAIAVSLDGKRAFVTNSGSNNVSVIDAATNTVVSNIPTPPFPYGIVLSPDGSKAYVANFGASVFVFNTSTNAIIATIPVPSGQLYGISISPDGSTVYAANLYAGNVVAINTATSTIIATIPVGALPYSLGNFVTNGVACSGTPVTFTITVKPGNSKPSDYAFLSNLELSQGTLEPVFDSKTFAYTARVSRTTFEITVTPTAGNAFASIKVNDITVASGTASPPIALSNGINDITIVVTAQNGINTKTYTLAVTKEPAPQNSLFQTASFETNGTDSLADGIKVHLGISPNGDGINDVLVIDGITNYPENKLLIMNSSGALVFETLGYDNSTRVFDGHSNKNGAMQLPGTYFYSLQYKSKVGSMHKTGFFILKY